MGEEESICNSYLPIYYNFFLANFNSFLLILFLLKLKNILDAKNEKKEFPLVKGFELAKGRGFMDVVRWFLASDF